jgi:hypothetical protein
LFLSGCRNDDNGIFNLMQVRRSPHYTGLEPLAVHGATLIGMWRHGNDCDYHLRSSWHQTWHSRRQWGRFNDVIGCTIRNPPNTAQAWEEVGCCNWYSQVQRACGWRNWLRGISWLPKNVAYLTLRQVSSYSTVVLRNTWTNKHVLK